MAGISSDSASGSDRSVNPARRLNKTAGSGHRIAEMEACGATVEALEELYRAGLPRFVRAAAAIVGDEGAGRDAVQEAFAQAVRKRTSFRFEAPLEAWVWRIVINEALASRRRRASALESEAESVTAPSTNHVPKLGWASSKPWFCSTSAGSTRNSASNVASGREGDHETARPICSKPLRVRAAPVVSPFASRMEMDSSATVLASSVCPARKRASAR